MVLLFFGLLALLLVVGALYVYAGLRIGPPVWRRLPSRPGLPPDMEYQCWSTTVDFAADELSDCVVAAVDLLAPVMGRGTLFAALRGARILIYREGTYPGNECGPAVATVVLTPRWAAVEMKLTGLAHALVHLVERHAGSPDYAHNSWDEKGLTAAVFAYEERRRRYVG